MNGYDDALISDNFHYKKIFQDPVHGTIALHPLCVKIIDTPQFQRLRFISQVGVVPFVFPSACHTRFEHSIGVCYLAGQFAASLQSSQPELEINDADILCVGIAGLCHDLGHGPFSHLWESFMQKAQPDYKWRHEETSIMMLDYLLEVNQIQKEWKRHNLNEIDLIFVKELIFGPLSSVQKGCWPYKGRPESKGFLYQIIANKINGVDVDKWDYFLRDGYNLGIKVMFSYDRLITFSRVLETPDNGLQICFREKEVDNLYDMFHIRKTLHRIAYQHRVVKIIEAMLEDALLAADKQIFFTAENGHQLCLSDAVKDMSAFCQLSDSIMMGIYTSHINHSDLKEAKAILHKIFTRNLYSFIGSTGPTTKISKDDIIHHLLNELSPQLRAKKEDLTISSLHFNYGMGSKNPMEQIRFYSKNDPNVPMKLLKENVSVMLPNKFEEKFFHVLCRREDEDFLVEVRAAFVRVCKKFDLFKSMSDSMLVDFTPDKEASPKSPRQRSKSQSFEGSRLLYQNSSAFRNLQF